METTNQERNHWARSLFGQLAIMLVLAVALMATAAPPAEARPRAAIYHLQDAIAECQAIDGHPHLNDDSMTVTCTNSDGVSHCSYQSCRVIYSRYAGCAIRI